MFLQSLVNQKDKDMPVKWIEREEDGVVTEEVEDIFLSYQPNDHPERNPFFLGHPDEKTPETAIVLVGDKPCGGNRYLLYRGDFREELAQLFPDRGLLIAHWKQHGGHIWSDTLEDN
jgi:hypothetical protein